MKQEYTVTNISDHPLQFKDEGTGQMVRLMPDESTFTYRPPEDKYSFEFKIEKTKQRPYANSLRSINKVIEQTPEEEEKETEQKKLKGGK